MRHTMSEKVSGFMRRSSTRRVGLQRCVSLLAVAATALVVAACGSSDSSGGSTSAGSGSPATTSKASGEPITIGLIADQTGSTKTIGDQIIRGATVAAELFGPINGRPVKFVVEDGNGFSASTAAAKAIKLKTKDNAVAVLGMAAGECPGAASVANRIKIPMIGNSCVIQDVVGKDCNYWFINGAPSPASIGQAMAVSAPKQFPDLIGTRWVVIGDDPGWSQSVAKYWNDVPGANSAGVQLAPFGTVNWGPYIAKLKASGAKALLLAISWGVQYSSFLQQADAAGLFDQMKVVTPVGFPENGLVPGYGVTASDKTVEALRKVAVLSQYGAPWTYIQEKSELGKKYVDMYVEKYGNPPTAQSNVQLNDTWMLLQAIKEVGTDPNKIMERLTSAPITTPYTDIPQTVQENGRQLMVPAFATELVKLDQPLGDTQYANQVKFTVPAEQVIPSAEQYGCSLPSA